MSDLAVSLASLILGVVATIWVSRYYFRRTVDKSLTPYVQFISSLFEGVDTSVREELKIAYKGMAVTELLEAQFLVANTGERPIRDIIAPLKLKVPSNCSLLDASVLHVSPEGREVVIKQESGCVIFTFPLLNTGEFFMTKLLLQGKARAQDFRFTITVDDLPPVLEAVPMPPDLIEGKRKRQVEWELLVMGLIFTALGASISALVFLQWPLLSASWDQGLITSLSLATNWLAIVSSAIAVIPTLLLLVVGPILCIGAFTDFNFPKRRRFSVPDGFHRRRFFGEKIFSEMITHIEDGQDKMLNAMREDTRA